MALERLNNIPTAMTAGTNLRVDLSLDGLLASDGGSIEMFIRGPVAINGVDITTGIDGDLFTIDALATDTTNWPAGIYKYTIKHTDTSSIVDQVQSGRLEIIADPANETDIDARTFTETFLDRLREIAKELALNPYKTLQIKDRIYSSNNIVELNSLIVEYETKLVREKQADMKAQGEETQNDLSIQFTD